MSNGMTYASGRVTRREVQVVELVRCESKAIPYSIVQWPQSALKQVLYRNQQVTKVEECCNTSTATTRSKGSGGRVSGGESKSSCGRVSGGGDKLLLVRQLMELLLSSNSEGESTQYF